MTAAAGQDNAPDCGATCQTRFPFATIDTMLELEESLCPIGVHIVGNRRSAERDGLTQHFSDCSVQVA